jgi:flagellar hook-length control protein FliK
MSPTALPTMNPSPTSTATNTNAGTTCAAGAAPTEAGNIVATPQDFGLLLSDQLKEELLPATGEQIAPAAPGAELSEPIASITVDPAVLGLQLNIPPVPAALVLPGAKRAEHENAAPLVVVPENSSGVAAKSDTPAPARASAERVPAFNLSSALPSAETTAETAGPRAIVAAAPLPEIKAVAGPNESTQSLAALQAASSAKAPESAPAIQLSQPVGSERWNTELGRSVQMLIQGDHARASLQVTPPDMGPIEIRIDLSGDEATISFSVQQSDTRAALENALPRLREMLGEAGINLGQSHIDQRSAEQPQDQEGAAGRHRFEDAPIEEATGVTIKARVGLVDTFA